MPTMRRTFKAFPALALIALAIPASASAQATRTWVSGVGDDANPCSRTAPCKTFAGAISKTANGGEINCLDPGGFGGVTIGKSLTIKCHYTEGGVLVAGTNAIVINAAATDKVTLKGLDINGTGVGAPISLVGVKVLSAKHVTILDSEINQFKAAIDVAPTSATTTVTAMNNHIHNNDIGVITAPGNNAITFVSTVLRWNEIEDNTCGVTTSAFGTNASTPTTTDCGAGTSLSGINKIATTNLYHNGITLNGTGLFTRGANATAEIGWNEITNNLTSAMRRVDTGHIRTVTNTNVVSGNAASDGTDLSVTLSKRQARKLARR